MGLEYPFSSPFIRVFREHFLHRFQPKLPSVHNIARLAGLPILTIPTCKFPINKPRLSTLVNQDISWLEIRMREENTV